MPANTISATTSAVVMAIAMCTLAACKRTTAGTAGEGGSGSGVAASAAARSGSAAGVSMSDSAGRADSAAGQVMLNPNGSAPAGVVPPQNAAGTTSTAGAQMPTSTSVFLPTLGTTVRVPSASPQAAASRSPLTSPLIPVLPQINPTQPDSTFMPRPAPGRAINPPNGLRPDSTLMRPVRPGSSAAVSRTPR
jgi:hypothetical protein